MKTLVSCAYNMDNCCVELKFTDGSMIAIDTIAVENEVADNMYQRSELDYLIYNVPLEYADLILNGDLEKYLKAVTQYKPIDSQNKAACGNTPVSTGGFIRCCFSNKVILFTNTSAYKTRSDKCRP